MTLTDPREWRLALGMMVADRAARLTTQERIVALHVLKDRVAIPGHIKQKVEAYWEARQLDRAKEPS